jgi:putative heme iron utilization protein
MFDIITMVNNGHFLSDKRFSRLSTKEKRDYAVAIANTGYGIDISDTKFSLLSQEGKRDYALAIANKNYGLSDERLSILSLESKEEYFYIIKMRRLFSNNTTALEKFQALMRKKYKLNDGDEF